MAYRYLGNKERLLEPILAAVRDRVPSGGRIADPMCGTATVAAAFATAGYEVVAADELTFPVTHARSRLLIETSPEFAALGGYAEALRLLNEAELVEGFFFQEYSDLGSPRNGSKPRRYFTGDNARRIDAIRELLRHWEEKRILSPLEKGLLRHDLILAVNRVANIAGTYGYYRSSWNRASLQPLRLQPSDFSGRRTNGRHIVYQGKVEDVIAGLECDLVYLDPPYTKRQYAGNYHILETLAVGDEFEPVGEGGLRDWYANYSAFCSKRHALGAFRAVLARNCARWVLISYSEDGVVPAEPLMELLTEFGSVSRQDMAVPRFRSNGGRSATVTEHLYCLEAA